MFFGEVECSVLFSVEGGCPHQLQVRCIDHLDPIIVIHPQLSIEAIRRSNEPPILVDYHLGFRGGRILLQPRRVGERLVPYLDLILRALLQLPRPLV